MEQKELNSFIYKKKSRYILSNEKLNNYNKMFEGCFLKNYCVNNITNYTIEFNKVNLLIYECIDINKLPNNSSQNQLKIYVHIVTLTTLILLFFLYFFFQKAINVDYKHYKKNKIFINNYTLILNNLDFNCNNYYLDINDLIFFLNNIIYNEIEKNEPIFDKYEFINSNENQFDDYENFNIFDISLSNINEKKLGIFKEIISIQNKITNIKNNNDSFKQKIKNNFREAYYSAHILYNNITNKNEENSIDKSIDNLNNLLPEKEIINENKNKKLEILKNHLKNKINNITQDISELHFESKKNHYVDIYITFRNPSISLNLYKLYKKNKIIRFFYYLFCCGKKIEKFYFKNKWLEFEIPNISPNDIQWENCYVSAITKYIRRYFSFFVSIIIIIITTGIIWFLKYISKNNTFLYYFIIVVCQIINLISTTIFEKLTKFDKYSTLTKNISSNIGKYFWLNFIITGISINIHMPGVNIFTYNNINDYFEVIYCILIYMILSIFFAHSSIIVKYIWKLLKRFIDSKCKNGKTTKLKNKSKYDQLYIGPEFPIYKRYSKIFLYLCICLFYGTYCPIIYIFFTLLLITIFIIDKYLIINFYRKPPYYNDYLSKISSKFLLIGIFIYLYGIIYNLSIPYLFNYYQNAEYKIEGFWSLYLFENPLFLIYFISSKYSDISITIFNISPICYVYIIIFFLLFYFLLFIFKLFKYFKKNNINDSKEFIPNINIGDIYSIDLLNKYYEIKKLELFKFLITNNNKLKNYSHIIKNYKNVIDYLKEKIDNKKSNDIENDNIEKNIFLDDTSYNLSFIQKYELFKNFDLIYNI